MINIKRSLLLSLPAWLAVTHGAAALGTLSLAWADWGWYRALAHSPFKIPDRFFGGVWMTLYTLMAVSMWLTSALAREKGDKAGFRVTRLWFMAILTLNVLWMWLFFFLRQPALATIDSLALLTLLFFFERQLCRYGKAPALILLPYPLWVMYNTALTIWVVAFTPGMI